MPWTSATRVVASLTALASTLAMAASASARTYTLDADFDEGTYLNVEHRTPDQLELDDEVTAFGVLWVAVSGRGTIAKIDTDTGQVLGEYRTAPEGQPRNPSRTAVDSDGNVWVTNRNAAPGSVAHIGLLENGQCADRNGNGTIETSTGRGDVRPWSNAGGVDTPGGVATAADECVIHYTRVHAAGSRHVSVTAGDDVWVGGCCADRRFDLIDGETGTIIRSEPAVAYGGYGGLVTGDGVVWSSRPLLRWDTTNPLTGPSGINWRGFPHDAYGLCLDPAGNVWNTAMNGDRIRKFAPDGTLLGVFSHGFEHAQGCVATPDGDVYVAHSIHGGRTVGHLKQDGTLVGTIPVGDGPTAVSVDRTGKVWVTNHYSRNAMRIDPDAGPLGGAGDRVGAVDLTTVGLGGNIYNFSDMTGSAVTGPPDEGSWTVVHDSGAGGTRWGRITRSADVPAGAALDLLAASSDDGVAFGPDEPVTPGADLGVADGRYLRVTARFVRAPGGDGPVLHDLTVEAANASPTARAGDYAADEGETIALDATGSTDPDGDPLAYAWDLDDDGTFETTGAAPPFAALDGPALHAVRLRACDPDGACDTDTGLVRVRNVAPRVDVGPDLTVARGETVALRGTFVDPAGHLDAPYPFVWEVPEGQSSSGTTPYGATLERTAVFSALGTHVVRLVVRDADGATGSDELVVDVVNRAPDCVGRPTTSSIWPPNHKFVGIGVTGVRDPDGDPVAVRVVSIRQDEPVDERGDGRTAPDGKGVGTPVAQVRAERSGGGDGRVYHIGYAGTDGNGGACTGFVRVAVPHDQRGAPAVDGGPLHDSTR